MSYFKLSKIKYKATFRILSNFVACSQVVDESHVNIAAELCNCNKIAGDSDTQTTGLSIFFIVARWRPPHTINDYGYVDKKCYVKGRGFRLINVSYSSEFKQVYKSENDMIWYDMVCSKYWKQFKLINKNKFERNYQMSCGARAMKGLRTIGFSTLHGAIFLLYFLFLLPTKLK